jgi:hypothetical protein
MDELTRWIKALPFDEAQEVVTRLYEGSTKGSECWQRDHEGRLEHLAHSNLQLVAERDSARIDARVLREGLLALVEKYDRPETLPDMISRVSKESYDKASALAERLQAEASSTP